MSGGDRKEPLGLWTEECWCHMGRAGTCPQLEPSHANPGPFSSSRSLLGGQSPAGRFQQCRCCSEDKGLQCWELGCSAGGTGRSLGRAGSLQQGSFPVTRAFNL